MDFGGVDFDGLVGSPYSSAAGITTTTAASTTASCFANSDPTSDTKQKWYGSGFFSLKQERPTSAAEDDWRDLKVAKLTDDFSASKENSMLLQQQQRTPLPRSNSSRFSDGQQMLSFSSPNSQTMTLPYYNHTYGRNTGYGSGLLTGVKGPFTAPQWMELEHQALIYKYITANSPIPSNLLIPIRKALDSAGFSGFPGAHLRPSTLGWGAFHLGFSSNTDPEPGRCRRTDGKKWRCSRDAVADQKYCERHINRGRHRSRKPVEGQSGHSVSGPTTSTAKILPTSSASLVSGGGSSSSLGLSHHHQLNNLQPGAPNPADLNRNFLHKSNVGEKIQDTSGLSMLSPNIGLKDNQFSIPKQQNPYGESTRTEFGLVCSDSLLNPLQESSSLINCRGFGSSEELNNREAKSQNSLRQFMDEWPKTQSEHSAISWPDIEGTQLSISIPMASTDFVSSNSSPNDEKRALSPLRVSTQMGLGVDAGLTEPNQRQANWIPISWQTSMGGPLGEVLHSTNNAGDSKNTSALNLMTEGWDSSPRLASSPTGVLQKTTFRSLSNSSAGSSPRTEHRTHEGASLCNNLLGSNLISSSMPAAL